MNDDELSRLLSGAFDAQARNEISDSATPPPPRFSSEPTRAGRRHRSFRVLAPLISAAAVIAVVATVLGIAKSSGDDGDQAAGRPTSSSSHVQAAPGKPVHVKLLNSDGSIYGVGMPVIAYFSKKITDAKAFQNATTATVNGKTVHGAWYFENSAAHKGYPIEAHFRLQNYWPGHAQIHLGLPIKGVAAGKNLAFDDSLTLDFATGASNISTVDDASHMITVVHDGKKIGHYPVSLGMKATPTSSGTKVIMEKGASICMKGPSYNECGVKDTQRLTYDGEYLHAAPWNVANIKRGVDSSNGCTNLLPADAQKLFKTFEVGDVVRYPNANGKPMQVSQGYGDWNMSWDQWKTGGLVPIR